MSEEKAGVVGINVRTHRENLGMTQRDLANRAGVDHATISRIESGERPTPRGVTLQKIAEALGLVSTDLTGETKPMPRSMVILRTAQVPIVRRAHASADFSDTGDWTAVALTEIPGDPNNLLGAIVVGDCMSPEIEPGDVVVWDKTRRSPQDGDVVVATIEGDMLVKRAYRDSRGLFILADNQGRVVIPNAGVLEGIVVAINKKPRRRPLHLGE